MGSGKGMLRGRHRGPALHVPGDHGHSHPFRSISFLACEMKDQIGWSLDFFPALRTRFCPSCSQGGQCGLRLRGSVPPL